MWLNRWFQGQRQAAPRTNRSPFRPAVEQLEGRTLLNAGALDPTFDGNGKVATRVNGLDEVKSVVLQPDGKILAAGDTFHLNFYFLLERYNPDGSVDTTFGDHG